MSSLAIDVLAGEAHELVTRVQPGLGRRAVGLSLQTVAGE